MEQNTNTGITAFAFGNPAKLTSNSTLAFIAMLEAERLHTEIYTEADIEITTQRIPVTKFKPASGKQPSTLQMAQDAVLWAKDNNYDELIVVAARLHIWRCIRDLKKSSLEAGLSLKITACPIVKQYPIRWWLSEDSKQKRTRSLSNWMIREMVLRVLPFSIYKKITG